MNDRRRFLTSLFGATQATGYTKAVAAPFRPLLPGFVADTEKGCSACTSSACKTACPQGIVLREGTAIPTLDFSQRGCTFCGDCSLACESDCFSPAPVKRIDAMVRIDTAKCLAWNGTICRSCADSCNDRAISFMGLWQAVIHTDACTSCGFCVGKCPTQAIQLHAAKG